MKKSRPAVSVKINGIDHLPVKQGKPSSKVEVVIRIGKREIKLTTATDPTLDQALWVAIRNRTH
jgi:hypothetical protein